MYRIQKHVDELLLGDAAVALDACARAPQTSAGATRGAAWQGRANMAERAEQAARASLLQLEFQVFERELEHSVPHLHAGPGQRVRPPASRPTTTEGGAPG